jgi:uncharacterized protein YjiS (DUF1127 family)
MNIDAIAPEVIDGVRLMPIVHERVDLAPVVRAVLDAVRPAAVAVELPTTLADAVSRAVDRLPKISVVISEEPGEDALVWVVAPGDPVVEGLRWAADNGSTTLLVDPDVRYHGRHRDPVPDPYALWSLGPERYLETVRRLAGTTPHDDTDTLRERGMAYHLHRGQSELGGTIVCLVGAAHADRVASHLRGHSVPSLARQRRSRVELRHLHPDSLTALLPDPPLAHAVHETLRSGVIPERPDFAATVSRPIEFVAAGLRVITGGRDEDPDRRARALVAYAAHHGVGRPLGNSAPAVDRRALGRIVWRVAAASYREQTRTETGRWQRRLYFDFARRYTRIQGGLIAGVYEWVVAARGVADDNLAWEVFDAARTYPWQEATAELMTARIDGDLLDLGTRTVRFRRRFLRVKQRPVSIPVRRRPEPGDVGEWLAAFDGDSICSYPPEDVIVEDYGRFLQRKAVSNLAAETSRVEPFVSSMLDGIDIRETLLNWHERRVYVRELGRAPGAAGSVVVIFDPDEDGTEFPYLMTWLGEHDQESDMAFYSSFPTRQIVGPGIMRATYGGFMLTYPPGRVFDIWRDPDYRTARSKRDVLLMAAVDYSRDKLVVHVAAQPPSQRMRSYAASQTKRIVHVPIGSLSPLTLRKVRVVHILAGRDKRDIAADYIW